MAGRNEVKYLAEIDGDISVGLRNFAFLKRTITRESSFGRAILAEGFPITQYC